MEITTHGLWTLIHGMGFGALYLMACPVALVELFRRYKPYSLEPVSINDETFLGRWLVAMAVLAWITVLTGAYVIYPWYRAVPPVGTVPLNAFPQALLKSSSATIGWHSIGMEWKEHVAWIAPISITMVAAIFLQYRRSLRNFPELRMTVFIFVFVSLASAGIAGFFGAELNKHAPVDGGAMIRILHGGR
jgi:hypothetical protein